MFSTVLVANRGEIALRILRTCREMGVRGVLAHSTADADSPAARFADATVQIGPADPKRSYLSHSAVVGAALSVGADAVHPGYGFLSEDADLARACAENGIAFIGPTPEAIEGLGQKDRAREAAAAAGVPVLPGTLDPIVDADEALAAADRIGFPVIVKAVSGGGGNGMAVVHDRAAFREEFRRTCATAASLFGDASVFVERYLSPARHVEVQLLADRHGSIVTLGARDCSVQRRRQKLIEESPPPGLPAAVLEQMYAGAVAMARTAGFVGAGTFEFLVDARTRPYFLEVNCRIQVEHPVTEAVTGLDLVRQQLLVAAGEPMETVAAGRPDGVAIECRVNAEDPERGFLPTAGTLDVAGFPAGPFVRVDSAVRNGSHVSAAYDSLLAKVIVWAPDREQAVDRMSRALAEVDVRGDHVVTTAAFLSRVLRHDAFRSGAVHTGIVDEVLAQSAGAGTGETGTTNTRPVRESV